MFSDKLTARIVGILFIIGTVAGVLSVVFIGPVSDVPQLHQIAANSNGLRLAALCVLIMALALAFIPLVIYPMARRHNERLAVGYIVFRGALETMTYLLTVAGWLYLLTLSKTSFADLPLASVLTELLLEAAAPSSLTTFVFIAGALMFYLLLYQARLVPRWLAGWGLVAAIPYLTAEFMLWFGLIDHMSTMDALLRLPLGIQEMVLAVWLIVKGFNPASATNPPPVDNNKLFEAYSH